MYCNPAKGEGAWRPKTCSTLLTSREVHGKQWGWRVGHLTRFDGAPIFVLMERNHVEGKQPYFYKTVLWRRKLPPIRYKGASISVEQPPNPPIYAAPAYHPEYSIEYNWDHFLQDHWSRTKEHLPIAGGNQRVLYLCIFVAVELSHRLWQTTAVPQFYEGRFQHVLPLYVTHDNYSKRPDLVATLDADDDRQVYTVRTLLPPSWAYGQVRAISTNISGFASWIEPHPDATSTPVDQ